MAIKLEDVIARVQADHDADCLPGEGPFPPEKIRKLVLETLAACGFEVAPNGDVYNPAAGAHRPTIRASSWSAPADNSRRAFGRRR